MKNAERNAVIHSETNGGMTDATRIVRNGRLISFVGDMGAHNRKRHKVQAKPAEIQGCAMTTGRPAQVT